AFRFAARVSGAPAPPIVTPPAVLAAAAPIAGLLERFVRLPGAYSAEGLRMIAGVRFLAAHDKATRELGYAPRPFAVGWPPTVEHEARALGLRRP
ncbi:MAG: epimerase, partial [Dehalococcoidia bacterium]|nr:epimerase [Dehalococcoidia bacterium]